MAFSLSLPRGGAALLVAAMAAAGCADESRDRPARTAAHADTGGAGSPPDSAAVAAAGAATAMQEPQIAGIIAAADSVEVAVSELGAEKATSPQVRQFAQMMVRDHNATRLQARQLFARMGVQPVPHPTAVQLRGSGARALADLQEKSGAGFDRDFMAFQVAQHESLLGALDRTILPVASKGELETLLRAMRTAVAAHLEQARQVQAGLAAPG